MAPDLTQDIPAFCSSVLILQAVFQLMNVFVFSSVFLFLTDHFYDLSSLNLSLLSPEELEDYVDLDFSFHQEHCSTETFLYSPYITTL